MLGSAVRAGRWLPAATAWLDRHRSTLALKPIALFSVCLSACDEGSEGVGAIQEYVAGLIQGQRAVNQAIFAGALDMSKLSLIPRLMMKVFRAQEGDFRDFEAITAWAAQIAPRLAA